MKERSGTKKALESDLREARRLAQALKDGAALAERFLLELEKTLLRATTSGLDATTILREVRSCQDQLSQARALLLEMRDCHGPGALRSTIERLLARSLAGKGER